jgi:hypothetical protein
VIGASTIKQLGVGGMVLVLAPDTCKAD